MNVSDDTARRKRVPRNTLKRVQHSSGSTEKPLTPEEAAGQELRHLRIARGWSQEEVAQRMSAYGYDWHQTLIGRIEAAQRPLRLNEAVDLAALFGVSLEMLLTRAHEADAGELRARIAAVSARLRPAEKALSAAQADEQAAREREQDAYEAAQAAAADVAKLTAELEALKRALLQAEGAPQPLEGTK
jgi:transcriptional regulator with XRE-family HTH domain